MLLIITLKSSYALSILLYELETLQFWTFQKHLTFLQDIFDHLI